MFVCVSFVNVSIFFVSILCVLFTGLICSKCSVRMAKIFLNLRRKQVSLILLMKKMAFTVSVYSVLDFCVLVEYLKFDLIFFLGGG